jgi:predicted ATPase
MPTLAVRNFSAINEADVSLELLTVLVGPQASGKSLLSKLIYFFNDILRQQVTFAREGQTLREVRDQIKKSFKEWFPPQTWGEGDFWIEFEADDVGYVIERRKAGRREPSKEVDVSLSRFVSENYSSLNQRYLHAKRRSGAPDDDDLGLLRMDDPRLIIQRDFYKKMREHLRDEFLQSQIFIPAGRAFFTTLGKAFAILEYGGGTEPTISRFGALYARLLDEGVSPSLTLGRQARMIERMSQERRRSAMVRLFNGHLRLAGNNKFLETMDGRRIPLSYMSSGQQELLPLWLVLEYFSRLARPSEATGGYNLLFIEEPEAHLFPSTQSYLIEYLVSTINQAPNQNRMFISTHSPYVLSKLNSLLKAGQLGEREGAIGGHVSDVVPRSAWLAPGALAAYAIRDGVVENILDEEDGLLSGSYLDEISNEIAEQFLSLLGLEARYDS